MPPYSTLAAFEALTGDDAPTKAELDLIAHCRAGTECRLGDGTLPATPSPARTIRAALLRLLIAGGTKDSGLHGSGIWLEGGYITGTLDLLFTKGRGRCVLDACRFEAIPRLEQARLALLSLDGSHLPGLSAQGINVEGSVYLRNLIATGTVAVNAAKIGGQLDCTGARLDGAGGEALNAQGVEVGESLFLSNLTATGTVGVNGARVGGQLACAGARLDGAGGTALHAQGVEVGESLFLRNLTATGTVNVNGARVGGQLDCAGASLDGAGGMALNAQRLHVAQSFLFRELKSVTGQIYLAAAHVGDLTDDPASWPKGENHLYLDGFTYDRISAASTRAHDRLPWLQNGSTINGQFHPQPYTHLAKVLSEMGHDRDARIVRMAARQHAAENMRLLDRAKRKTVRAIRRLSAARSATAFAALEERIKGTPGALASQVNTYRERYALFHSPLPTPANAPIPVSATTLAFARQDFRNQMWQAAALCRLRIGWSWTLDLVLRRVIGYGYAPERSLVWLLALFLIATTLANRTWEEGSFAPNTDVILVSPGWLQAEAADCIPIRAAGCDPNPALTWSNDPAGGLDWDSFNRYGYAADLVIPVLDLGQTDAWAPSRDRGFWGWGLWWGRWALVALGWIVTALGAAAITGIMQRKAPE